jgi:hypothetical protein
MKINGYVEWHDEQSTYSEWECCAQFKYWGDAVAFAKMAHKANRSHSYRVFSVDTSGNHLLQWHSDAERDKNTLDAFASAAASAINRGAYD